MIDFEVTKEKAPAGDLEPCAEAYLNKSSSHENNIVAGRVPILQRRPYEYKYSLFSLESKL